MKPVDDITGQIVDAAFKLHTGLGLDCLSLCTKWSWPVISSNGDRRSNDKSPSLSSLT